MMKLLVYGYLHNIRSSRRLAEACKINIEVRWLLKELEPDSRTISYFRKDNIETIKDLFYSFLNKIKPEIELGYQSIDGSRIQANNGKDKNFTLQKLDDRIAWKKAHIEEFLRQIDMNDLAEGDIIKGALSKEELLDKIDKYKDILTIMEDRFFGTDGTNGLYFPDLIKVADSYGIKSARIENADELESKVREVIDSDEPVLCDVLCDEWQYLIPRISSEKMPDGTLKYHDYSDMYPFLPRDEYERNMIND